VQIGESAGPRISLPADGPGTSGLEISGAGGGLTPEAVAERTRQVWEWIEASKLHADLEPVALQDVVCAWGRTDPHSKRIVILP